LRIGERHIVATTQISDRTRVSIGTFWGKRPQPPAGIVHPVATYTNLLAPAGFLEPDFKDPKKVNTRQDEKRKAMKRTAMALVALLAYAPAASAVAIFSAFLTGNQANPPSGSELLASAVLKLNDEQNRLEIHIMQVTCRPPCLGPPVAPGFDLDGNQTPDPADDVTGVHIHRGAPGENGPEVFGLIAPNSDLNGDLVINAAFQILVSAWDSNEGISTTLGGEVENFFAGNLYVDLHTNAFPGGEIRGQIVPEPGTAALVIGGLVAIAARARVKRARS